MYSYLTKMNFISLPTGNCTKTKKLKKFCCGLCGKIL